MTVLIKGMEMPQVCADCPFRSIPELFMLDANRYHYISRCIRASEEIEDPWRDTLWQLEHKESWCPLIEVPTPHGRLIDADAIFEQWYQLNFDRKISDGTLAYWNVLLGKAPTVIEGEPK